MPLNSIHRAMIQTAMCKYTQIDCKTPAGKDKETQVESAIIPKIEPSPLLNINDLVSKLNKGSRQGNSVLSVEELVKKISTLLNL